MRYQCTHHPPNRCPPRVNGHNVMQTPYKILAAVELCEPVSLKELPALVDATPEAIRRAFYRLLAAGDLERVGTDVYLGRTI